MRLSELKTGEKAVIVKVLGHGGFRKRIIEMGFIRGKVVESVLNAPLHDPIKYRILDYEVSLRKSEAQNIEIVTREDLSNHAPLDQYNGVFSEEELRKVALNKRKHIRVALVGNPNCGKTTLFNYASGAHEHVGNYSGVTIDAKEGTFTFRDYQFTVVDLPGTYSLSAYSPEEMYVRTHLVEEAPDVVINVIDSTNLERNLFLTTQLVDMNVRMVMALNMYDEFQNKGASIDYLRLSHLLGAPVVPTNGRKGWGLDNLFHVVIKVYEGTDFYTKSGDINLKRLQELHDYYHQLSIDHETLDEIHEDAESKKQHHETDSEAHLHQYEVGAMTRHIHINHGQELEKSIDLLRQQLSEYESLRATYSTRFLAIKLLEGDREINKLMETLPEGHRIIALRDNLVVHISKELKEDAETAITNAKYGFISGALKETYKPGKKKTGNHTKWIDQILLHKYWGYPIFLLFMYLLFESTFELGAYPMTWIEAGFTLLSQSLDAFIDAGPFKDLLLDGIIGGVGGVMVFLPNILILYLFISLMEDTGYMSRAAFLMDKFMHGMGLHGKSFIPMIMGFGCSVPAILSTRTIENKNSRMITMLVTPLMSCSARLPVYLLLAGAFFPNHAGLVLFGIYMLGIIMAVLMARLFKRFLFKKDELPFVMELPPYRIPTVKSIVRHMWEKGAQYLRKMGSVILVASIIIWFLGYYPHSNQVNPTVSDRIEQQENSYIGQIGRIIAPVMEPLGFDWKMSVAILTGISAKEVVVSTLGVLYTGSDSDVALGERLKSEHKIDGTPVFTPSIALSFMVFILIYLPCIATIVAIKNESGSWKWGFFTVFYTIFLAWLTAFVVYRMAILF